MLKLIDSLRELPFGRLMGVYGEGNRKNGAEHYPHLSENLQILEAEQDFYAYLQTFFRQKDSYYALWYAEDKLVSALRVEPYADGWLIAAVETHPACRNLGYAKLLLTEVCGHLVSNGKVPIYSHIGKDNLPSQKVHLHCGFREILPYSCYADGTVNDYCHTYCLDGK
ncbi:MAG: GNAT family N-acetyltransferase [Ruminococcaceae bacterium]|nr:GNAT family N-acetyltransferase [Oscillospiraceae bacterium]